MLLVPPPLITTTSPAITRDQISVWKRYFEGRVVISSVFGKGGRQGVLQTDGLAGVTQPHDSLRLRLLTHLRTG
jgi:hypothetical protein